MIIMVSYIRGILKKGSFMKFKYLFTLVLLFSLVGVTSAQNSTAVGNWQRNGDQDNNGIPDEGVVVSGHYTSVYAYDVNGDYYWDLGDGRVQATVGSIDALDAATLTTCDYVVNYRGTFENDPFMDSGWIRNNIRCYGYDGNSNYNYLIVHESDHRYTGNPELAEWGNWEYVVYAVSGVGNTVRPMNATGS